MNVMNIKHYLSASAALVLMAACSDYDPGMSGEAVNYTDTELATIQEYAKNFDEHYGGIDPYHTWGFGDKGSEDEKGTRATQPENNMWAYLDVDGNIVTTVGKPEKTNNPYSSPLQYDITQVYNVPGLPGVEGKYFIAANGNEYSPVSALTKNEIEAELASHKVYAAGDVTDEEIEYVSWWFRTHPGPSNTVPPFTEYFIQDISQDYDRVSYPNGDWKLVPEGGKQMIVPQTLYDSNGNQLTVDTNGQPINRTEGIEPGMDYFSVLTSDNVWEHNYNFNKQKANPIARTGLTGNETAQPTNGTAFYDASHYPNRTLKYWSSYGPYQNDPSQAPIFRENEPYTTSFSYHNSNDSKDYQNYKLVHLEFDINGHHYDGYYIGFDYEMHKEQAEGDYTWKTDIEPDGYYSNWILKLSPGNPEWSDHEWWRIMCEDLGNTYDYDFNDLVYDVYFTGEAPNYIAHIKVQAAGGTYPIFIGEHNAAHEAHGLLGHADEYNDNTNLYQPVNVGTGLTGTAEEFTLDMGNSTNPDDILIYVDKPGTNSARPKNDFSLPKVHEASDAPQKICIPGNTVKWTLEHKNIELAYPKFTNWVQDETDIYDFGNSSDWTKTDVATQYLFK